MHFVRLLEGLVFAAVAAIVIVVVVFIVVDGDCRSQFEFFAALCFMSLFVHNDHSLTYETITTTHACARIVHYKKTSLSSLQLLPLLLPLLLIALD